MVACACGLFGYLFSIYLVPYTQIRQLVSVEIVITWNICFSVDATRDPRQCHHIFRKPMDDFSWEQTVSSFWSQISHEKIELMSRILSVPCLIPWCATWARIMAGDVGFPDSGPQVSGHCACKLHSRTPQRRAGRRTRAGYLDRETAQEPAAEAQGHCPQRHRCVFVCAFVVRRLICISTQRYA